MSSLQADPEDRIAAPAGGRAGLMGRLLGPLARLRKRKQPAAEAAAMAEADMTAADDAAMSDGAEMQEGAEMQDGAETDAAMMDDAPPQRLGFKHKLLGVLYLLGLVLWPPFLRGNLSTLSRRLLAPAWLLLLLGLVGGAGYIAVTGQSLPILPGSEVVIGVAKLALPPEAKLEGDQKRAEQAQKAAPEGVGRYPSGLLIAPDPALVESSGIGQMPKIGADGRQPWRAYARPYDEPADRPRMSIVLANLGLNESLTARAAELLPPAITFAFNPYAPNLRAQIENARMLGHEVLLQLPMEPFDYPASDPGPNTLLTTLTEQENARRLDWALGRVPGYVGFTNLMGAKFTSSPEHMRFLAQQLKQRGLMFVDARTAPRSVGARVMKEAGGVYAIGNRWIDQQPSGPVIESRLDELERLARGGGVAVGFAQPYPITLDRLVNWSKNLAGKSFALAPVSALVNRQTPE